MSSKLLRINVSVINRNYTVISIIQGQVVTVPTQCNGHVLPLNAINVDVFLQTSQISIKCFSSFRKM